MKTTFWFIALISLLAVPVPALVKQPSQSGDTNAEQSSSLEVVERGDHFRVWQRVTAEVDETGKTIYRTNTAYTELETGMNVKQPDGSWVEASDEIEITGTGGIAQKTRHQVAFAGNCNSPVAIDFLAADGKKLQSRILGLSYFDSATGQSVLIAELKDSDGRLLDSKNEVIYYDAFTDFKADVLYRNSKAGLEQDILIRENLTSPAEYQLNPATTRLQVLTEFMNPPVPAKRERFINGVADEYLDFGDQQMGSGRVYVMGEKSTEIPVTKQWAHLDGRVFLIEEIPYNSIEAQLKALPARTASLKTPPDGVRHQVSIKRLLPPVKLAQKKAQPMKLAGGPLSGKGVVLDYTLVASDTNKIFAGDKTFFVSGNAILGGTQTVFEAGCIFKFAPTNSAKLTITSPINWQGTAYRPIVMTARDDSTVGDSIGAAALSGYYADTALYIDAISAGTNAVLQNLRIAYANTAIALNGSTGHIVSHAQLVNCANGVAATNAEFSLRNALLYNVLTNFNGSSSTGRCEHLTVNTANWLNNNSAITLTMTNSLLVGVANTGSFTSNSVATGSASAFQTVGAASHYLLDDTYRTAGTTNINASLLADLRQRTTYPPIELTSNFTVDTTLSPQAHRETGNPDLGFGYVPLDFVVSGRTLTNSTLTLTNGVALGTYGSSSSYGVYIRQNGNLVSEGTPIRLNQIVRYNTVQEQATTNWSATSVAHCIKVAADGATLPKGSFRFTGWSLLGGIGYHFFADHPTVTAPFAFKDCQFGPGSFNAAQCSVALTNCLLERVGVNLSDDGVDFDYYAHNNHFQAGSLTLNRSASGIWQFKDNLFDQTTISQSGAITHDYNGYVSTFDRLLPNGSNDQVLTNNPTYLTSYLGNYYYPTNDGMLSLLLDAGSRNATNAGLYHFTVTSDQVKELTSAVDIGFHYVATDINGVPTDTDGDGLADYFEDRNGNGVFDTGDLASFNLSDTDGDGVSDYLEYLQGCNPLVAGAVHDTNGVVSLRVYTPLK